MKSNNSRQKNDLSTNDVSARHILIVEDESDIADSVEFALVREGFRCSRVVTGLDTREFLGRESVELIILDVGLPDCSGFDLFKWIRRSGPVPVIFLTARSEEVDRILGLEMGADDYVVKPFSPRELTARVKAVLRRLGAGSGAVFLVDPNKHLITYFGKRLLLSRYEYRILSLLIARPGWVFDREKIMEQVWEDPLESYDRTVDTHIKTIRSKLREVKPEIDPIITHRGVGYSLAENIQEML